MDIKTIYSWLLIFPYGNIATCGAAAQCNGVTARQSLSDGVLLANLWTGTHTPPLIVSVLFSPTVNVVALISLAQFSHKSPTYLGITAAQPLMKEPIQVRSPRAELKPRRFCVIELSNRYVMWSVRVFPFENLDESDYWTKHSGACP